VPESLKLLLLGGNGQLGRSIQESAQGSPFEISAPSSLQLDMRNAELVVESFKHFRPDYVINAAGWTNVDLAESNTEAANAINFGGVKHLALASRKFGARLIHFSTDYVFSGSKEKPYTEEEPQSPINEYGKSKAEAEKMLTAEFSEISTIFRTSWLFGRHGNNFVKTISRKILSRENQINVVGDQLGHPTSSLELSQMIITYLNHEWKPGIYNLTNSGSTTWANFASEILRYFPDSNCRIHEIRSEDLETTTKRPRFSVLDNSKVINSLGLSMSDWKIALKNEFPRIKEALK
jgi:dTDP-4-dehydrorhamnose reductase